MSMTNSELSMLSSCINADPFTQEQSDFLNQWWMIVTDAQVDSFNSQLPEMYSIVSSESNDGVKVIPIAIITDEKIYASVLEELQALETIKLQSTDFPQRDIINSEPTGRETTEEEMNALLEALGL
jgi:hypothetical protein